MASERHDTSIFTEMTRLISIALRHVVPAIAQVNSLAGEQAAAMTSTSAFQVGTPGEYYTVELRIMEVGRDDAMCSVKVLDPKHKELMADATASSQLLGALAAKFEGLVDETAESESENTIVFLIPLDVFSS